MKLFLFPLIMLFVSFSTAMAKEDNSSEANDNFYSDWSSYDDGYSSNWTTYTPDNWVDYFTYGNEPILQLYPSDERENGRKLSRWLLTLDISELGYIVFLDDPCKQMPCLNLSSNLVKQLASEVYSERKRSEVKWLNRGGLLFAALGFLVSLLAYNLSKKADRLSVKNEVKIDYIQETLGKADKGKSN